MQYLNAFAKGYNNAHTESGIFYLKFTPFHPDLDKSNTQLRPKQFFSILTVETQTNLSTLESCCCQSPQALFIL